MSQIKFDFLNHLYWKISWSSKTFGPGPRTHGIVDHIRKELKEIEADPRDLEEWIDVVILALDGAWRAGFSPEQIIGMLVSKSRKNQLRRWPDWRKMREDEPIEHVKDAAGS